MLDACMPLLIVYVRKMHALREVVANSGFLTALRNTDGNRDGDSGFHVTYCTTYIRFI